MSSFENVPSVEYKRLDDSLEDLTVSLNEKPGNDDKARVTGEEEDIGARENLFKYIDEDPFTPLSGIEQDIE